MPSRSSQLTLHGSHFAVPVLYSDRSLSHPKIIPSPGGGSAPPSNAWFPGSTGAHMPNGISIDSAVFARCMIVPNRQQTTDNTTPITIDRNYMLCISMQPKNQEEFQISGLFRIRECPQFSSSSGLKISSFRSLHKHLYNCVSVQTL